MENISELIPLLQQLKTYREDMSGDRSSVCHSSIAFAASSGGRSSSCGGGSRSSSNKNQKNLSKKAGWEDAGVEFYREAYPAALEGLYDARITTLLPSKRCVNTLNRTTVRRRVSTRSRRIHGNATLVHTNRRGSETYLEVLPDLTQGVEEHETWEKLQQIRCHAVSIEEKRKIKHQLLTAPTLRTRGLASFKLSKRKITSQIKSKLREFISKIEVWHWSLRYVEGNFGTGLVAFFTFIKWLLYLNIFTCIIIAIFLILPLAFFAYPKEYKELVTEREEYPRHPLVIRWVLQILQGTGIFEVSYLFYGFYPRVTLSYMQLYYNIPLCYLIVMVFIFLLSLTLLVRGAARGLRESLKASEGQFYQLCHLIFGGWDYCIENKKAAFIKKRAIYNELRNHIETEQYREQKAQRTKRERCRLYIVRLLINIVVLSVLIGSFAAIYKCTGISFDKLQGWEKMATLRDVTESDVRPLWWESLLYEYLPSSTIVVLNIVVPFTFRFLVQFEHYTPNFILTVTLLRTIFLRLASLFVLLYSVYQRIGSCKPVSGNCIDDTCHDQVLCWETYVGQQLYKLSILDLLIMFVVVFFFKFPQRIIGHHILGRTRFRSTIGDIEFHIPKNVLDVVYGQTLCWLGMFYSPLLPAITSIKLILVFYIKYFDCTVNSTQSSELYRTSKSNALFISVALISFIVTIIPVGFSIAEIKPSSICGPFHSLPTIWNEIVKVIYGEHLMCCACHSLSVDLGPTELVHQYTMS